MEEENIEPFGREWRNGMRRLRKDDIIYLFEDVCREKNALEELVKKLESQINLTP